MSRTGTLACLLLILLAAQARADDQALYQAAQKEGSVVLYVNAPLDSANPTAREFEAAYPGIKANVVRIVGVAQYQRFAQETQAHQYIADILSNSDRPSMVDLIHQNFIAAWKVPTSDRFPQDMRIDNYAYAPYANALIFVYNSNKLSTAEVGLLLQPDWKGLLDPRFKGHIATTSQATGAIFAGLHMLMDPALAGRFGLPFLKAFGAQKPTVYGDVAVIGDRVAAGDADIGAWPGENGGFGPIWASGAPIRWVYADPTPVWGSTWQGISALAPHPNAARLSQDWLMSEAGAISLQKHTGGPTTLEGVADQREVARQSWYPKVAHSYAVDWDRWGRDFDKTMASYRQILKDSQ